MERISRKFIRFSPRQGSSSYHNGARVPAVLMLAVMFAPLWVVARLTGLNNAGSGLKKIRLRPGMTPLQLAVVYELVRRDRAAAQAPSLMLWSDHASLVFLWTQQSGWILNGNPLPEDAEPSGRIIHPGDESCDHVHQFTEFDWNATLGAQREPAGLGDMRRRRRLVRRQPRSNHLVETAYQRHVFGCITCPKTVIGQVHVHA